MSGRIPRSFIDDLISRADIVEIVGRRVALKKAGASFKGLCPFHDEKTPSFIVTSTRGTYKCFGCGAYGNAIQFLMDFDHLPFPEAVEALADSLGVPMPQREADPNEGVREPLLEVLAEAATYFRSMLRAHPAAIEYLKARGIDGTTAARFGIGYAPALWSGLLDKLGRSEAARRHLLQAGLIRRNDQGREYDYFRDRIVFPIRDPRGRTVGFGGRVLGDGEPKYLNSPETPVFEKGRTLYGLYEARQDSGAIRDVLVVEGYMDVIAIAQHDAGHALATLGTATTREHVQQLTRFADEVVFCFDGDAAGRRAAWRALETCLPFGGGNVSIRFMLLPAGEDPDSILRERGTEAFIEHKSTAPSLSAFFLAQLQARHETSDADARARLLNEASALLARLPQGIYREMLLGELATSLQLPLARLTALFDTAAGNQPAARTPPPAEAQGPEKRSRVIRRAIALVLKYPAIAANVGEVAGFDTIEQPGADLLRGLLAAAADDPGLTTAHLIERFRDHPDGQYLPRLAGEELLADATHAPRIVRESMERIVTAAGRKEAAEAVKQARRPRDNPAV
ncbi:MAG TPA: DNA primase [Gammaproteobacteria bacterium]|nr:DNA primase [Gammaproteobacteria bacterium]